MSIQKSGENFYGPYDFSELNDSDRLFWLGFAERNKLPKVPERGHYKFFVRTYSSSDSDSIVKTARAVITADGKIRNDHDFVSALHRV